MENFELYIDTSPKINRHNGQFIKGHKPFNKGIPMKEWMDGRKIKKVIKCLDIGRIEGNKKMPDINSKQIIGIKDGKLLAFKNAITAERYLKGLEIKVNRRNINAVCHDRKCTVGKYSYVRRKAGGYRWFFADEDEKYKDLININYE